MIAYLVSTKKIDSKRIYIMKYNGKIYKNIILKDTEKELTKKGYFILTFYLYLIVKLRLTAFNVWKTKFPV